jgi:excisionase family DNA binding protein
VNYERGMRATGATKPRVGIPPPEGRIAVDVDTAAEMLGISRGALYPLVMAGDVPSFKIGRRRLVPIEGLREWAATQVEGDAHPTPDRPGR